MTRNQFSLRGLQAALAATLLVGFVSLVGCGTDVATAPAGSLSGSDNEVGEVPLPDPNPGISTPRNFTATKFGEQAVELRWQAPEVQADAHLFLDGQLLAVVRGRASVYMDTMVKPAGAHRYSICFVHNGVPTREANTKVMIQDNGLDTGRGQGGGRGRGAEDGN